MKSILTIGLFVASLTTYAQHSYRFSHKDLGLGYRSIPPTSSLDTQRLDSPRNLLNLVKDTTHKVMVRAFADRFSGQDFVVLTSSLLDSFASTKRQAAGVHLFLGNENGTPQVIITHTRLDTLKVNDTFAQTKNALGYDSASNYKVFYDQAYYWDSSKRDWRLVKDQGTLKQSILSSRKRAKDKYGFEMQGYYLSKDLLLKIRQESGQDSLTVFFGQKGEVFHLIIPISPKAAPRGTVHYATDYDQIVVSQLTANPVSMAPPPPKDHNTIRPCQPYCSN